MNTTISISQETRNLLREYGKKSENYDEVIRRMHNTIHLQEQLRAFVDEQEYSSLEEAKQWTKLQLRK